MQIIRLQALACISYYGYFVSKSNYFSKFLTLHDQLGSCIAFRLEYFIFPILNLSVVACEPLILAFEFFLLMTSFKVTVVGGCGGIGQPLCLLLKSNPRVSEIAIYDLKTAVCPPQGVAADLSHIDTPSVVKGYTDPFELPSALKGANVVVIPAGAHRNPGQTRDDLFLTNAKILKELAEAVVLSAPTAIVLVVTNPVNSLVPLVAEVFKKAGVYDPKRIIGVTSIDNIRAAVFFAEKCKVDVKNVSVPVVGGHGWTTVVPLFSQASPKVALTPADIDVLTRRCQDGGSDIVNAKKGAGSATLSVAHSLDKFLTVVLKGLAGEKGVASAYVDVGSGQFMAGPVEFDKSGAAKALPLPSNLTDYEKSKVAEAKKKLVEDIKVGQTFLGSGSPRPASPAKAPAPSIQVTGAAAAEPSAAASRTHGPMIQITGIKGPHGMIQMSGTFGRANPSATSPRGQYPRKL